MRLVMALKVRNEGDIIGDNLRLHHALGVDHFIVTDNRSDDETSEILRGYADAGLATVIREESEDYRHEAIGWMQRMARLAATEHEADWVLHGDADELWWPAEGTLRDTLAAIPSRYGAVVAPRTEFVGRPDGPGTFAERLIYRESRSSLRQKIAHRGDPTVVTLDRGGHNVASEEDDPIPKHGSERAVLRGGRDTGSVNPTGTMRFVWAPRWPLRVMHFPVRSREQIRHRTEVLLYGAGFTDRGPRAKLRSRYEGGELERIHRELVWDDAAIEAGLESGELVRDERLSLLLPRCPDPLGPDAAPAGSIRVEPSPEELERELDDLELDAMQLISRFQYRLTINKKRFERRTEQLEAGNRRLRRRIRRLRRDRPGVAGWRRRAGRTASRWRRRLRAAYAARRR
jgi:Glycosyl transferase family 2